MAVAIDTETFLAAPGRQAPPVVCLTSASDTGQPLIMHGKDPALVELVRAQLESGDLIVGHNIAYDLACLANDYPELMPLIFDALDRDLIADTMICQRLIDIATDTEFDPATRKRVRYSLAALAERLLGETVAGKAGGDVWRVRYHELYDVPLRAWPQAARDYALNDAALTLRIWHVQSQALPPDLFPQVRYAFGFQLMRAWGIRTDGAAVERLKSRLTSAVNRANVELMRLGFKRADGTKNTKAIKAAVERVYLDSGRAVPRTEKGAIQASAAVLRESGCADLQRLADIAADEKELSAFIPTLERGTDAPIHPYWKPLGTKSGRSSCLNPNLQQQPRRSGVRECYVPRPGSGNVFVAADYASAELRALAQILLWRYGRSQLADEIRAGIDPLKSMAAHLMGIPLDDFRERYASKDPICKDMRQLSKAIHYGYPGGLGAESMVAFAKASYGVELTENQARQRKQEYLIKYPEMRLYFKDVGDLMGQRGGRCTVEHFISGRLRGGCNFTAACNTFFQGLVSDGAKLALYLLCRRLYCRSDVRIRPVAFIHDEIIVEAPENQIDLAAQLLTSAMVEGMQRFTPDIPVRVEAAAMRRWYKDAEPVLDASGRLAVWEPTAEGAK